MPAPLIIGVIREGDVQIRVGKNGLILEFTEHYHVIDEDMNPIMWEVIRDAEIDPGVASYFPPGATGLPVPGVTIATDGLCLCRTLTGAREEKNPTKWKFTATWSSESPEPRNGSGSGGSDPTSDPLTWTPVRESMFDIVKRHRIKDLGGRAYTNGAYSLFSPPLEVEDELLKWEFTQVEPYWEGALTGSMVRTTEPFVDAAGAPTINIVRPPGIYSNSTLVTLVGVTDDTIAFFNGALNHKTFRYNLPFTLKLSVKKSTIQTYLGYKRRVTEYAITRDKRNWLDKTINAGPYFLAPKIISNTATTATVDLNTLVGYDYVYYTKDVETVGNLSQDESGPLGMWTSEPSTAKNILIWNNLTEANTVDFGPGIDPLYLENSPVVNPFKTVATEPVCFARKKYSEALGINAGSASTGNAGANLLAVGDGLPTGGAKLVRTESGEWTFRAVKPTSGDLSYIEFLNDNVFDFGLYLRVL